MFMKHAFIPVSEIGRGRWMGIWPTASKPLGRMAYAHPGSPGWINVHSVPLLVCVDSVQSAIASVCSPSYF